MKKIAMVTPASPTGEWGGAERLYSALINALSVAGVMVDQIDVVADVSSFDAIKESYLTFYDLDLNAYDGVISTKVPSYAVRHPNHICYLVHTIRVFYDMFDQVFPQPSPEIIEQRNFIHNLDRGTLCYPGIKQIFSIGHEVADRLVEHTGIHSEVIHPALEREIFQCGEYDNYLFMPGRLHHWKRVDIVINAMKYIQRPLKLKIAGIGDEEEFLKKLANGDRRIEFLGKVSDAQLVDLYSNAFAVPFTPVREDYGYITIEAFRSGKPVVTCSDSGEPSYFVKNDETGFVCDPNPKSLASKIEWLFDNRDKAREMGRRGKELIKDLNWGSITKRFLQVLDLNV